MQIQIKRVYDPRGQSDGTRVLVERLWPRGVSKEAAGIDIWAKSVAPTTELRRWFAHEAARWYVFRERYFAELEALPDDVGRISKLVEDGPVTFVISARDRQHNNAVALRDYLERLA